MFVSRWLDSMMLEYSFPIISELIINKNLIKRMILIEQRLRKNSKCLFENFTSIIFSFIGKIRSHWWQLFISSSLSESLRRNYNSRRYWIDIELRHLSDYDDNLCDHLQKQPAELLPLVRRISINQMTLSICLSVWSFSSKKLQKKLLMKSLDHVPKTILKCTTFKLCWWTTPIRYIFDI